MRTEPATFRRLSGRGRASSCTTARRSGRRGSALLLAIVICVVAAASVVTLWRVAAGSHRALLMDRATPAAAALADSVLVRAIGAVDTGAWRALASPGSSVELETGAHRRARWRVTLARTAWQTLLVRATTDVSSGVVGVRGRADHRVVIPMSAPFLLPASAVTGAMPWQLDIGADVAVPIATPVERTCRDGRDPAASSVAPFIAAFDTATMPILDPDTVARPMSGAFRLTDAVLRRPLRLTGFLFVTQGLRLDADLLLTGVLVVDGSVQTGIGHLDVTGAVITGDAGGGRSGLGNSDRVHYDACAVRQAVARVTRPARSATWTSLVLF